MCRPFKLFAAALVLVVLSMPGSPGRAEGSAPDLSLYPLLFKRADMPTSTADAAQIIMVGDTSMARGVEDATKQYGVDYPFSQVAPWLQAADMAVGNYE